MDGDNGPVTSTAAALLNRAKQPLIIRLFDYWLGKRRGRRMPSRHDIDPVEIPWALSKIALMDYVASTDDYRFRLAGAEIAEVFGRGNLKDVTLRDIAPPEVARVTQERWRPLIDVPAVLHVSGFIYYALERYPLGERLLLPLSDDDAAVTSVLALDVRDLSKRGDDQPLEFADVDVIPLDSLP